MEIHCLDHNKVLSILPDRKSDTHKGDYGKILLLCGSHGYTGAAELSALGALRSGAGLVYLGVPECIYNIEAIKLTEPIVFSLPHENGMLSCDAMEQIMAHAKQMDAVLIGPGLGISQGTREIVKTILKQFCGPVVLDADGIKLIAEHKDILRERTYPTILTPHMGEFQALVGQVDDRLNCAISAARDLGIIIALKGHETIITDGYMHYRNNTGNPGMAVGGSGDMLSGMIVSLLGQKIPSLEATAAAVWLHGATGDICAEQIGEYGMIPSDMLKVLPRLMK